MPAATLIGQLTTDGYPTRMIGRYQIPDAKKSPSPPGFAYFQTWKEAATAWAPAFRDRPVIDYWPQTGQEFYWDVARGATGMAAALPGGALAWKRFGELIAKQTAQTGSGAELEPRPTWAIIPRKINPLAFILLDNAAARPDRRQASPARPATADREEVRR